MMRLLVILLALLAVPGWISLSCGERNCASIASLLGKLQAASQRRAELEAYRKRLFARIEGRARLARQLGAGEVTFSHALYQLSRLYTNAELQAHLATLRRWQPGRSDEERLCRELMSLLTAEGFGAAEVIARLEHELSAYLESRDEPSDEEARN